MENINTETHVYVCMMRAIMTWCIIMMMVNMTLKLKIIEIFSKTQKQLQ